MLLVIPIRTEATFRRVPNANYFLIGANMLCYLIFNSGVLGESVTTFTDNYLAFKAVEPKLYQFFTYQFLHAGPWHLVGNLLFLWVFGNAVNGKMGNLPYLMFYLAGGVAAAYGNALVRSDYFILIGASGSIAAVTTAYLTLFPRSRVTVMVWLFFFIHFFEIPAMILIGVKIIVWDNIVAPSLQSGGNVAHQAHLAGYLFGILGSLFLLWVRAVPRDHFDLLALWHRWNQRREFAAAMADPTRRAQAQYGSAARVPIKNRAQQEAEDKRLNLIAEFRGRIQEAAARRDFDAAAAEYDKLLAIEPKQCLSEQLQLEIGQALLKSNRFDKAAIAYEHYLASYPKGRQALDVGLLLGIIYARDLRDFEKADMHLTNTLERLHDSSRRSQCMDWLKNVRHALGRPEPAT